MFLNAEIDVLLSKYLNIQYVYKFEWIKICQIMNSLKIYRCDLHKAIASISLNFKAKESSMTINTFMKILLFFSWECWDFHEQI